MTMPRTVFTRCSICKKRSSHMVLAKKGDARCYTMEDARDAIQCASY